MILNVYTIVLLFADLVSLVLALLLIGFAARQIGRSTRLGRSDAIERFERGATLVMLLAVLLGALRFLAWPLCYATLESYVPSIEGAMCIYGVTRLEPGLALVVQALKPLAFFLVGGWFLLDRIDRRARVPFLGRRKSVLLLGASVVMLVEVVGEVALIAGIRPTFVVTCCTTVADVTDRPTSVVPSALLGPAWESVVAGAFFGLTFLMAAAGIAGALLARRHRPARPSPGGAVLFFAGAVATLSVAWPAAAEVLAPAWTGLPYHHCLYCFVVHRDAPLAVSLFLLGVCAACWGALVRLTVRGAGAAEARAAATVLRCRGWSGFFFAAAGGMALIHVLAAPG